MPCYDWYHNYVTVSGVERKILVSENSYYKDVPARIQAGLSYAEF